MEPLRNISVQEGKSTQLKCTFSGEPVPQIHWTKNDVTIMPSAVFRVSRIHYVRCGWGIVSTDECSLLYFIYFNFQLQMHQITLMI